MAAEEEGLRAWKHFIGAHALALRAVEARLRAAELPPLGWYDVLLELERAGGRLRLGELAARLVIEPYNATRLVDRLERAGHLRREKASEDKRGAVAVITEQGGVLREQMWPVYRAAILEVFAAHMTDAQARELSATLRHVSGAQRSDDTCGAN